MANQPGPSSGGPPSQPLPGVEPFTRTDAFGEFGQAKQGPLRIIALALGAVLLLPLKGLGTLICLLSYWTFCRLSCLIPAHRRARALAAAGRVACRSCLFSLGFLSVRWVQLPAGARATDKAGGAGAGATANGGAALPEAADGHASGSGSGPSPDDAFASAPVPPGCGGIVANHASWADILLHMSRSFPAFVARDSTATLPLIGIISQKMRCVFVDRDRKHRSVAGVSDLVRDRMRATAAGADEAATPLLLFPEGTTTNGRFLMRFKTGAFLAGVPVRPVVFRYASTWGLSPTWEMIPAMLHIFLMLATPTHNVTCYELPVYVPSDAEKNDPALYAANVRAEMLRVSGLEPTDATFDQKMALKRHLVAKYAKGKKHRRAPGKSKKVD